MNKQEVINQVASLESLHANICDSLWNNPELGGHEKKSADLFRNVLEKEGFKIVNNDKLEHAFYAEYGEGSPVIAFIGEYDALPGLSQKVQTTKEPVVSGGVGHGCGHNLLGSAAAIGAIAAKRFIEKSGTKGTVRFYGCPEEELLCGKVKMAYYNMFDGCDAAITWHPMNVTAVYDYAYLANMSAKFHFTGKASHAAFAPEQGRSALDAVELMSVGSNYLREHVIDGTRIHYSTTNYDCPPNIVPDRACAWYFVRAPHMSDVKSTMDRIIKVANGAALMTETQVKVEMGCGCYEFQGNNKFTDLAYKNLCELEKIEYTEEELNFAQEIQDSLDPEIVSKAKDKLEKNKGAMYTEDEDRYSFKGYEMKASSDSGDVSFIMPSCLFTVACWPIGVAPHTWQATACNGMGLGKKGSLHSAKAFAGIAYDLFTDGKYLKEIKEEFEKRKKEPYVPVFSGN